jgi:hypothetical protein
MRMKNIMISHVGTERETMFADACQHVTTLLKDMIDIIEDELCSFTDSVYVEVTQDYSNTLVGNHAEDSRTHNPAELGLRCEMAAHLANFDLAFKGLPLTREAAAAANNTAAEGGNGAREQNAIQDSTPAKEDDTRAGGNCINNAPQSVSETITLGEKVPKCEDEGVGGEKYSGVNGEAVESHREINEAGPDDAEVATSLAGGPASAEDITFSDMMPIDDYLAGRLKIP